MAVYSGAMIGVMLLFHFFARTSGPAAFMEDGVVEWLQWILVTAAAGLFLAAAVRMPAGRSVLGTLAMLAALASIREQNNRLDDWLPGLGWSSVAGVVVLGWALWFWPRRGSLPGQAIPFVPTAAFALLLIALLTVVGFAQQVGDRHLWIDLVGLEYARKAGRTVQEITELLGYMLLFAGAVESVCHFRTPDARRSALPL